MTTPAHLLYRPDQVREMDARAIAALGAGYPLMCRAGAAAYEALRGRWPKAQSLRVVCGLGNNGGDGYVLARLARADGLDARVLQVGDPGRLRGDALRAAEDFAAAGGQVSAFAPAALGGADLIVDALFGTGLDRPVAGEWAQAIAAINAQPRPVLALDLPSGLHGGRGAVLGQAVRAQLTVSFIAHKSGLFTGAGPACRGELRLAGLDVPEAVYAGIAPHARLVRQEDVASLLRPRPRDAHKGCFGHVLVIGGNHGMGGAARMAAEAAARVGAGLVSVATRPAHVAPLLAARPELMCRGVDTAADLDPLLAKATVVAIGPGLGQDDWARALYRRVLAHPGQVVADADALNLLAAEPSRREGWILTPHPGEAARLLKTDARGVQDDRFGAAARLAADLGAVVVLKGVGTLVQAPGESPWVCDRGNPGMASGGMGDVLTGIIAGLLAQGLAAESAAMAGAFVHAVAADRAAAQGERGLLALDLMDHLRALANP